MTGRRHDDITVVGVSHNEDEIFWRLQSKATPRLGQIFSIKLYVAVLYIFVSFHPQNLYVLRFKVIRILILYFISPVCTVGPLVDGPSTLSLLGQCRWIFFEYISISCYWKWKFVSYLHTYTQHIVLYPKTRMFFKIKMYLNHMHFSLVYLCNYILYETWCIRLDVYHTISWRKNIQKINKKLCAFYYGPKKLPVKSWSCAHVYSWYVDTPVQGPSLVNPSGAISNCLHSKYSSMVFFYHGDDQHPNINKLYLVVQIRF